MTIESERKHSKTFPGLDFVKDWGTDDYDVQRGREQQLYDMYHPPLNRIRPISLKNKSLMKNINAAERFGK